MTAPVPLGDLRHVTLKLSRAREHQAALFAALKAFLDSAPYTVGVRHDSDTRRPIYFVTGTREVPDAILLLAGDALQNAMSALDHLAFQLVARDAGGMPPNPRWIYFPIADSKEEYDMKRAGKMPGASAATLSAIDALQPYRGGNDSLWHLYRLNNIEKHRLLLAAGSQADGVHLGQLLRMSAPADFPAEALAAMASMDFYLRPADKGFPLKAGFELYHGAPDEAVNPAISFRFTIALNEPDVIEGEPLAEAVARLLDEVARVVEVLSPLLASAAPSGDAV